MSQRALEREVRYFGGEHRTGADPKNPECGITRNAARDALTEEPRTAGEIARLLDPTRVNFSRLEVSLHLDKLVELGEVVREYKNVRRASHCGVAHYRLPACS